MNAMIFAAGLGTRLKPLTDKKPKALVEIEGCPLLEIAIKKLIKFGIKHIIINVFHFADQIIDFIESKNFSEAEILISDERNQLLDTGGGLLKAKDLFIKHSPIITYNVDILCDINLDDLVKFHNEQKNFVTMFVQNREASRYLIFDDHNRLCGWQNPKTGEEIWSTIPQKASKLGYNGIQIVDYEIFSHINKSGAFSIIPFYIELAAKKKICGWLNDDVKWFDIGTLEKISNAVEFLNDKIIK